jgi:type IV pilus assembly protein PilX
MKHIDCRLRKLGPVRRQDGAALIVGLILLLIMTVLGVTSMRTTTLQERMAGNLRDTNLAFQAAEAALRDGEQVLEQATLPPFTGANGLLPRQNGAGQAEFWNGYDWSASRTAPALDGVVTAPVYVIEELPPIPAEGDSVRFGALPDVGVYRVTARAVGGSTDAVAILQTTYRR